MTTHPAPRAVALSRPHLVGVRSRPEAETDSSVIIVILVAAGDHAQVEVVDLRAHPHGRYLLAEVGAGITERAGDEVTCARDAAALDRSCSDPHPPLAAVPTAMTGTESLPVDLSAREHEVLELIVDGLTNEEIAGRLYLSINTIKTRIRTCYRKIGVARRPQAVAWGLHHGLQKHREG